VIHADPHFAPSVTGQTDAAEADDTYALLDLFRAELAAHTALIKEGLPVIAEAPGAREMLESMRRSAHAMWGGARLLELEEIGWLASALRTVFERMFGSKGSLQAQQIQQLHAALRSLQTFAAQPSATVPAWIQAHLQVLQQHHAEITAIADTLLVVVTPVTATATVSDGLPRPVSRPPLSSPETPAAVNSEASAILAGIDKGLLDLFLTEVETHTDVLSEGLLVLEQNPGALDQLEALMRSAHSIKGGARVVGLDCGVRVAHLLEDCFVAAQRNRIHLGTPQIDVLLQGVDMLTRIAAAASQQDAAAFTLISQALEPLLLALGAIQQGQLLESSPPPLKSSLPVPPVLTEESVLHQDAAQIPAVAAPVEAVRETVIAGPLHDKDRTVRVTAHKIERLMGLAGEVVVSASWLSPFSESLLSLKRAHLDISATLERLTEALIGQVIDPTVTKEVGRAREKSKECTAQLAERLNQLEVFTSSFGTHADRLYREMIGVRMRPFADGVKGFPRMVRDLARQLGKQVNFEILGKATEVDQDIQERLDAPLNHLLRNALDHGLETPEARLAAGKPETGVLRLEAGHRSGMLMISISDDGRGIELSSLREKIRRSGLAAPELVGQLTEAELLDFLFLPGFTTAEAVTEISGRGVGLDVVHSMVHEVGGVVRAESRPGKGMTFYLELPLTLSVIRTFLVEIAGEPYAFPLARIDRCLVLTPSEVETVEDRQYFRFGHSNIALVNIHDVLELRSLPPNAEQMNVVVISDRASAYGLVVDKFLGEYDLVVRPLDPRLGKLPDISAAAVMLDGSPVLIFDVEDLVHSIDKLLNNKRLRKVTQDSNDPELVKGPPAKQILVVDDSITVREMERKLLESKGYLVDIAVDGLDAWNALRAVTYDMVVTDVDMPRLNGIELVRRIKQNEVLRHLPVIIVSYKDSEEYRLQGLQAGANYYLTKSNFEDDALLAAVADLIGAAHDDL